MARLVAFCGLLLLAFAGRAGAVGSLRHQHGDHRHGAALQADAESAAAQEASNPVWNAVKNGYRVTGRLGYSSPTGVCNCKDHRKGLISEDTGLLSADTFWPRCKIFGKDEYCDYYKVIELYGVNANSGDFQTCRDILAAKASIEASLTLETEVNRVFNTGRKIETPTPITLGGSRIVVKCIGYTSDNKCYEIEVGRDREARSVNIFLAARNARYLRTCEANPAHKFPFVKPVKIGELEQAHVNVRKEAMKADIAILTAHGAATHSMLPSITADDSYTGTRFLKNRGAGGSKDIDISAVAQFFMRPGMEMHRAPFSLFVNACNNAAASGATIPDGRFVSRPGQCNVMFNPYYSTPKSSIRFELKTGNPKDQNTVGGLYKMQWCQDVLPAYSSRPPI